MSNFLQIGKAWDYIAHRRMIAFWTVMVVMLPLPWLMPACTTAPKGQAHYDNCRVLSVYDGDTMTVNCQGEKIKVRLYCIDAPEMGQEPWGKQSGYYLRSLLKSQVSIESKTEDRYGRQVASVWSGGQHINLAMVATGHAAVYRKYCDAPDFLRAQRKAVDSKLGIWRVSGEQQEPWGWRAENRKRR